MEEVENLIVGAGLSGLMLGYILKRNYIIMEGSHGVNTNINTPFYLHSPIEWLPTDWKTVDVHNSIWDGQMFHSTPNLRLMNDYSRKIVGKIVDTSMKFLDGKVKQGFIPAREGMGKVLQDLKEEVSRNIHFETKLTSITPHDRVAKFTDHPPIKYRNLISTIPLPVILNMVGMKHNHEFRSDPIISVVFPVEPGQVVDAYQIVYIADNDNIFYRASLMDQVVCVETMEDVKSHPMLHEAQVLADKLWGLKLGSGEAHINKPGKFHPIEKTARKMLMAKLTNDFNIYCLGRYATWSYKRIDNISSDAQEIVKIIRAKQLV